MKNRASSLSLRLPLRRSLVAITLLSVAMLAVMMFLSVGVAHATDVYTSSQKLRAGGTIADCIIQVGSGSNGIEGSGAGGAVVRNVTVEGGYDAIKVGSGSQTNGLTIDGLTGLNTSHVAAFFANVSNGVFRNLALKGGYALYLERGNHGLSFYDVDLTSTADWCVHAYNYETQGEPSDGILMDGGTATAAKGGFVLSGGWDRVTIRNMTVYMSSSSWSAFRLYGGVKNVIIENCEVWGGSCLLDVSHTESPPQNVTLRNVVYHGSKILGSGTSVIQGLTVENVTLASAGTPTTSTTSTTVRTTTNTTQAPTTTTTRSTTTTTQAPTTTTSTTVRTTTNTTQAPTTTTRSTTTTTAPVTINTNNPPTTTTSVASVLTFSAPVEGQTVTGIVKVGIAVQSSKTVGKVRLYVDSASIGSDYRAPYSFDWNTRRNSVGTHSLTAIAYDRYGRVLARSTITVKCTRVYASTSNTYIPSASSPTELILSSANSKWSPLFMTERTRL